ncbi:MAG: cytochrome c4 [Betaproteobacteria bacterium]|nr:cytochrome c4 [Betaproteobacteria bacterium]
MRQYSCLLLAPLLISALAAAQPAPAPATTPSATAKTATVPNTLEQRLAACAICHGKQGEGTLKNEYYPRLAGKPTGYLYNQLIGFRERRRSASPIMTYMVGGLSDNYLHEIAAYYAGLRPPFPAPFTRAPLTKLKLGETIALKGLPARDIPACTACHGGPLSGMLPAIPGLVGLNPEYIAAQLGAWRSGSRNSTAPDCMARIASRMTGDDISAVAAFLAFQVASPDVPPAPAQAAKLPLACGSAP